MANATKNSAVVIFLQDKNRASVQAQFSDVLATSDANTLYRAFLEDTIQTCLTVDDVEGFISYPHGGKVRKIVDGAIDRVKTRVSDEKKARLERAAPDLWEQKGNNVSENLRDVFTKCFDTGYKRVLMIDCVTPTISKRMLENAAALLGNRELVFGPTLEGSFYLMGMSRLIPNIFERIDWSEKDGIYSRVIEIVEEDKLNWEELELWYNLRQPGDLEFVARDINAFRIAGNETSARQTETVLENLISRFYPEGT